MSLPDKEIFENIDIVEQKQLEYFLRETGHPIPDWLTPTNDDYENVIFAYHTIFRFQGDFELAAETYNLALQKSREETDKIFDYREGEKQSGQTLALDDFDGNWEEFKNYLDGRYEADLAEYKKIWQETFQKYFREMINPNTGEVLRLQ